MSELENSTLSTSTDQRTVPSDLRASEQSTFSRAVSYLVFHGHILRFTLELSVCLVLYLMARNFLHNSNVSTEWQPATAWAIACFSVAIFDHFLLIPPYFTLRRASAYAAQGKLGRALVLIEQIGPFTDRTIRLDAERYFQLRAEFLIQCEHYSDAEQEIALGVSYEMSPKTAGILRAQLLRNRGDFGAAFAAISHAAEAVGELTAALEFENALTQFEERKNLRAASKTFEKISQLRPSDSEATQTQLLSRAYHQLCRLWTGYAEEAIIELTKVIDLLSAQYSATERVRPQLARLYLERSYYFATHQEPDRARFDLRIAQVLCGQPASIRFASRIKEELNYRAGVTSG